jgi:hypothetical protein
VDDVPVVAVTLESNDVLAEFTTEELQYGIDQYCQLKLGVQMMDFVHRVRAGEKFDGTTEEIADLVRVVDRRLADEYAKRVDAQGTGEGKLQGAQEGSLGTQE